MTARLIALSGLGGKSPACFLLEAAGARVMLDLGEGPEPGVFPDLDGVGRVDAVILTHGHKDHLGGIHLRERIGNPPVWGTDPVRRKLDGVVRVEPLPVAGEVEIAGITFRTGRNGHAPGGVWVHAAVGGGFLYTADICMESMLYAYDAPPPAEAAVIDGAYGDYEDRLVGCVSAMQRHFAGPVLLPCPADGRGLEVALAAMRAGAVPALDEAHMAALADLLGPDRESVADGALADLEKLRACAGALGDTPEGVMIAAGAACDNGAAGERVARWEAESLPAIVLTGYTPKGSPALRMRESGRAHFLRWNVHPPLADQAALVRGIGARLVFPAFADSGFRPAWETAFAPARVSLARETELFAEAAR